MNIDFRYGSVTRRVHWTAQSLEGWIRVNCSAMNYHNWVSSRIMDMRQKIGHAAALLSSIGSSIMAQPGDPLFFSNQPGSRSFYSLGASTETHHPTHSTSSVVMPATVGIPWAGPASDALSAQSSGVELERAYSSFWSGLEKDDGLNPESQSLVTTPAASTKEQKRNARRGTKDWINEQEEHMKRRSKYMLRAEEPDDSDDTDIGNDTDCDEPIARGVRHGGAPIIPMERRSNSVPTLLDAPPLHHWRSNSALLSNHSWTNSKSRGQIP
ncbi:hypothetical protein J3R30DRAFT_138050 [Lentinula aciculospora]|uniref:Uncharacterized protein n=1 Tax=Lentinula aciculospora TaxID=153920 RepID=A0A9W9DY44_9AGAR|nr:hypothetical protein J3R30DRAFT_138050 [Lentinula aciculospora]